MAGHSILSTPKFWRYSVMILALWGRALSSWRMALGPRFLRYGIATGSRISIQTTVNSNRKKIAVDFGEKNWSARHMFSIVSHSMNAGSVTSRPWTCHPWTAFPMFPTRRVALALPLFPAVDTCVISVWTICTVVVCMCVAAS